MIWSAREQKSQFHFLTITLELALLGSSELRWWVIALLIGFNIHSCKHQLIVAKLGRRSATTVIGIVSPGYECYTRVTCSTWFELGSAGAEQGTRVSRTVGL